MAAALPLLTPVPVSQCSRRRALLPLSWRCRTSQERAFRFSSSPASLIRNQFTLHLIAESGNVSDPGLGSPVPHLRAWLARGRWRCARPPGTVSTSHANALAEICRGVGAQASAEGGGGGGGAVENNKLGVLFVCLGNICRSPTAEAVFMHEVKRRGLQHRFTIDSAGTYDYHEGEPADARMRSAALKRGIAITSISRPIRPADFESFDLIVAMDRKNLADIQKAYHFWNSQSPLPPNALDKVKLMCSYCRRFSYDEVPDPYYGGAKGFELVLDLLEDACGQLLDSLTA